MFLERLLDRAAGAAPVVENAGSPAAELDHPAWGPVVREPEDGPAEIEAEPLVAQAEPPRATAVHGPRRAASAPPPEIREGGEIEASPPPQRLAPVARRGAEAPAASVAAAFSEPAPRAPASTPSRTAAPTSAPRSAEPQGPAPARAARTAPLPDRPVQPIPRGVPDIAVMRDERIETIELYLDIGRIDLVGASAPDVGPRPAPLPSRPARPGPLLSLTDYLAARRGGRG